MDKPATLHKVFDVIHCDTIDFVVKGVDARRDDFRSMDELAKYLCNTIGLELELYDLFQRLPSQDGTAKISIRSGRWVLNQRG